MTRTASPSFLFHAFELGVRVETYLKQFDRFFITLSKRKHTVEEVTNVTGSSVKNVQAMITFQLVFTQYSTFRTLTQYLTQHRRFESLALMLVHPQTR